MAAVGPESLPPCRAGRVDTEGFNVLVVLRAVWITWDLCFQVKSVNVFNLGLPIVAAYAPGGVSPMFDVRRGRRFCGGTPSVFRHNG